MKSFLVLFALASFSLIGLFNSAAHAQITTSTNQIKIVGVDGSLTLGYSGGGDSILTFTGPSNVGGGDAENALALGGTPAGQWLKYVPFNSTGSQTVATMSVTPGVYEVDVTIMSCYPGTGWAISGSGVVSSNGIFRSGNAADNPAAFNGSTGVLYIPATIKAYVTCTTGSLDLVHTTGPGYGFNGHVTIRRMQN